MLDDVRIVGNSSGFPNGIDVIRPTEAEHGRFLVLAEPLVEVAHRIVAVENNAVLHVGFGLVELGSLANLGACGELDLVAILCLIFLDFNGNLVVALVIHQVIVPAFHNQRCSADKQDDSHYQCVLPRRQGSVLEHRERHDDDKWIAENQRAILDDRLAEHGIGEGNAENDDKPADAHPAQRIAALVAPADDERQKDDEAHGKHEQWRIVHRILQEIG